MYHCHELLSERGPDSPETPEIGDLWYCGAPACRPVSLPCPAGRPDAVGLPYCAAHGGTARSRARAETDWNYVAPACVGDAQAVLDAGLMALGSEHAYLVLREEAPEQRPEMWRVDMTDEQRRRFSQIMGDSAHPTMRALGLLGPREVRDRAMVDRCVEYVASVLGEEPVVVGLPARLVPRRRPWLASLGVGSHTRHVGAFETRQEALEAGRRAWRQNLEHTIGLITARRGGTLSWGYPIAPRSEPIVVEPRQGESAWDACGRAA